MKSLFQKVEGKHERVHITPSSELPERQGKLESDKILVYKRRQTNFNFSIYYHHLFSESTQ